MPHDNVRRNGFDCGNDAEVWFNAEYLLWWIKKGRLPPLVGTIPTADAQSGNLSVIAPIYGGSANDADYDAQSGIRISTGMWANEDHTLGLDASFFQLEHKTTSGHFTSPGAPVIGPVFFDPVVLRQTILLTSVPNFTSGPFAFSPRSAVIGVTNNNQLWGADVDGRYELCSLFFMDHLNLLAGFRYLYFGEGLDITTNSVVPPGSLGANILASDHFGTRNQFAILPEITLTFGYQVTDHLRATIGYNFLYLSQVLRAGDQADNVDGRQVRSLAGFDPTVKAVAPVPTLFSDRFYVQGLNVGLEFAF